MKPLSQDLRVLFCGALDRGMSARAAARMLEVSAAAGVRWAQAWRTRGSVELGKVGGHMRPLLASERGWRVARIEQKKDLTLHELLAELHEERGGVVCCDTLWRFLGRCGKTLKKDARRQGAGPARCRPLPQSLEPGPALGRPQAHGLHQRNLGRDQHDPHAWLVHEGYGADRQGSARALENADFHCRAQAQRHRRALRP